MNGPVVELRERLHLQMVAVHLGQPLTRHVLLEILSHILRKVVGVVLLQKEVRVLIFKMQ